MKMMLKEDKTKFFQQLGIYMSKWDRNFNPFNAKPIGYPVWINLYTFAIEFWTSIAITKIGNAIEDFQGIDERIRENLKIKDNLSKERKYVLMNIST